MAVGADSLPELVAYLASSNPDKSEQRVGFRVPIPRDGGLEASVSYGGMICPVRTLDISLSGILVELPPHVHELPLNAELKVELQHGTESTNLRGVARRRKGSRYGISFADAFRQGKLEPPDSLVVIFKRLETDWLAKQVEVGMPVF